MPHLLCALLFLTSSLAAETTAGCDMRLHGQVTALARFGEALEMRVETLQAGDRKDLASLQGRTLKVMPLSIGLGVPHSKHLRWIRQLRVGQTVDLGIRIREGNEAIFYRANRTLQWRVADGEPAYVLSLLPGEAADQEVRFLDRGIVIPERKRPLAFDPGPVRGAAVDESAVKHVLLVEKDRKSGPSVYNSVGAALERAMELLRQGDGVKVKIGPGIWRESLALRGQGLQPPLVIEGAPGGRTIISGAEELPGPWQTLAVAGRTVYRHAWPHDFAPQTPAMNKHNPWTGVSHRTEMLFLDGAMPRPVVLEEYDYDPDHDEAGSPGHGTQSYRRFLGVDALAGPGNGGDNLEFGTFGVVEREENGEGIYVLPPAGVVPGTVAAEAAVRLDGLVIQGKPNLVLRDLVVERFRGRGIGIANCDNVLVERVESRWNNDRGLGHSRFEHATLRQVRLHHNGQHGCSLGGGCRDLVWEDVHTDFNNWRSILGGQPGWYLAGIKWHHLRDAIFRRHTAIGNFTYGTWGDILCGNILIEDGVFLGNHCGIFLETGKGPHEIRRCLISDDRKFAVHLFNQDDVLIKDSIIHSANPQFPALQIFTMWRMHLNSAFQQAWGEEPELVTCLTGPIRLEGSVLLQDGKGLVLRDAPGKVWHRSLQPLADYSLASYSGQDNTFFGADRGHAFTCGTWRGAKDLAGHLATNPGEVDATWADPRFIDPKNGDFRLQEGSPLDGRASELPVQQVDPALLDEMRRMRRWVGKIPERDPG